MHKTWRNLFYFICTVPLLWSSFFLSVIVHYSHDCLSCHYTLTNYIFYVLLGIIFLVLPAWLIFFILTIYYKDKISGSMLFHALFLLGLVSIYCLFHFDPYGWINEVFD